MRRIFNWCRRKKKQKIVTCERLIAEEDESIKPFSWIVSYVDGQETGRVKALVFSGEQVARLFKDIE